MKRNEIIYNKTAKFLQSTNDKQIDKKLKTLKKILDINNKKERYSLLYDELCNYLDDYFYNKNICEFKCNICAKRRQQKKQVENGCCYSLTRKKLCPYLDESNKCSARCMACKLFICSYLKQKGYRFSLNNIYLSKYTLNVFQKYYLTNTFFKPKEEILNNWLFKT